MNLPAYTIYRSGHTCVFSEKTPNEPIYCGFLDTHTKKIAIDGIFNHKRACSFYLTSTTGCGNLCLGVQDFTKAAQSSLEPNRSPRFSDIKYSPSVTSCAYRSTENRVLNAPRTMGGGFPRSAAPLLSKRFAKPSRCYNRVKVHRRGIETWKISITVLQRPQTWAHFLN